MRYLVTGHTGFKGSWLAAMLKIQGNEVYGISLPAEKSSLFNEANIAEFIDGEYVFDIRDAANLKQAVNKIDPEVIIHLAAQPLVRAGYQDPIGTFEINLLGTLNVLEATKELPNLQATLIITTDKVYKDTNKATGYVESDPLGGNDPYSASKAAADIATQSWRISFGQSPISIARAGNVIGGGDWAKSRIVSDIFRCFESDSVLQLRSPGAIRPWQHVLDCLSGYLCLVQAQLNAKVQEEWNFGPNESQIRTVKDLVNQFEKSYGRALLISEIENEIRETSTLILNSNKSRKELGWVEKLDFANSVEWTANWFKRKNEGQKVLVEQIEKYLML
jgi:CDP-glucose 4,6-dehydratase